MPNHPTPSASAEQEAIRLANGLTGYIAHIQGSFRCRHCELAQEIADALRTAEARGTERMREQAAKVIEQVDLKLTVPNAPLDPEKAHRTIKQGLAQLAIAIRALPTEEAGG